MLDMTSSIVSHNLAAALAVVALAFRSQITLRAILLGSTAFYLAFYLFAPGGAAWDSSFWAAVNLSINAGMLAWLIHDRTHTALTGDERLLFEHLAGALSPGEFRRLKRLGTLQAAKDRLVLTREGAVPDHLYFIVRGSVEVAKAGRQFQLGSGVFIGEIAFLNGSGASATVTAEAGTRLVAWPSETLRTYLDKAPTLRNALLRAMSADLAAKVAAGWMGMPQPLARDVPQEGIVALS
jgi:hypothetical protein